MCKAQDHFIFLTLLTTSLTCPLSDPDVGPTVLVRHIEQNTDNKNKTGTKYV